MSGSNSSAPGVSRAEAISGTSPQPLGLTVHALPEASLDAHAQRTWLGRVKMLLVFAICASPVIASYFTYFVVRPEGRGNYSTLIEPTHAIPETLSLTTLDGRSVPPSSLRNQWLLVVVAGGACDAGCEKGLYLQRQLRETLGRERDRVDKIWLVTDDAPVRPDLLAAITPGGATTVLRVPREALSKWLQPAAGEALERHMYIVDPMGQWMMRTPVDPDPSRLKRDVEKLLRASSFWDQPGRSQR